MVPMRCTHPERIRSGDMLEKYRAKTSSKVKFLGVSATSRLNAGFAQYIQCQHFFHGPATYLIV
ncbi:unnamed protein product [Fusarium graminearum]|uniref:Uncharacterized protein n=1 Tax=Gibberella zeae TaxID=5518 RepID=A0A4E9DMZ0_GIBZA|nr:unnamed protein product [Fusarium graminearum]CAF3508183.1 unnamed protein product [Fusarium graminearum]CAG1988721.1 unnamed protein product [Fusarium graminearum]CAG1996689.1 unnamed protein product [Fusarium graminearum]